ncbi:Protein kinase-like domain protein [Niveomyces insectorum RCEF 264]|uniref:Protein kinase-like domain protein n=1 Tax=Niveomyces insectorum RCEF 264 TaxID=1081102 RepID=A0A167PTC7_9HYPO|nr:Protein kinase-like domain protein [Niveomyces insectorum RCEF 264]
MADENIIFIVNGDEKLIKNEHNEAFLCKETQAYEADDAASQISCYGERDTPAPDQDEPEPFFLRITTDHVPKKPHLGFVIGRDKDVCDIFLDDPRISKQHLAVWFNLNEESVLLKNHCSNGTKAEFQKLREKKVLKGQLVMMEDETVNISFRGNLGIQIRRFYNPVNWKQYCADQREEKEANTGSTLAIDELKLDTNIQTTNASKRAPVYLQGRLIGEGAYTLVHKAIEKYTGSVYAMKSYSKNLDVLEREANILKRLEHKHIVSYVDYYSPPTAQLIMEYVDGPNLEELLAADRHRPLDSFEKRDVLEQLLQATAYLHGMNIAHRDIRPANIIPQRDPIHVKLVDFGSADYTGQPDARCGAPLYAAPEMLAGRRRWTTQVDMFALGVVALRLLYGVSFDLNGTREPEACLTTVLRLRRDWATENPPYFDLVYNLLSEDPDDRPSARECLRHQYFLLEFRPPWLDQEVEAWSPSMFARHNTANEDIPDTESWAQHSSLVASAPEGSSQAQGPAQQSGHFAHGLECDSVQISPWSVSRSTRPSKGSGEQLSPKNSHTTMMPAQKTFRSKRSSHSEAAPSVYETVASFLSSAPDRKRHKHTHSTDGGGSRQSPPVADEDVASDTTEVPNTASRADVEASSTGRELGEEDPPNADNYESEESEEDDADQSQRVCGGFEREANTTGAQTEHALPEAKQQTEKAQKPSNVVTIEQSSSPHPQTDSPPLQSVHYGLPPNDHQDVAQLPGHDSLHEVGQDDADDSNPQEECIVIHGHRVPVDNANGLLNFLEICKAGKADFVTRFKCQYMAENRGALLQRGDQHWIAFKDAFFLCEKLHLSTEPLLSLPNAEPPNSRNNYFLLPRDIPREYTVLWWNESPIFYTAADQMVNATQMMKAIGHTRSQLAVFLAREPGIRKKVERGFTTQGTYIAAHDAVRLCICNDLSVEPLRCILRDCGESDVFSEGDEHPGDITHAEPSAHQQPQFVEDSPEQLYSGSLSLFTDHQIQQDNGNFPFAPGNPSVPLPEFGNLDLPDFANVLDSTNPPDLTDLPDFTNLPDLMNLPNFVITPNLLGPSGITGANFVAEPQRRRRQPPQRLPYGYRVLESDEKYVIYMPRHATVNATHLLAWFGISRHRLSGFFRNCPDIRKTKRYGLGRVQGSYIHVEDAAKLCEYFDLDMHCVNELRRLISLFGDGPPVSAGHEQGAAEAAQGSREEKKEDQPLDVTKSWEQPEFCHVRWEGKPIGYVPSERSVNVTRLLSLLGISRVRLRGYWKAHPDTPRDVYAGLKAAGMRGTYMSKEDAVKLCQYFDLNMDVVHEIFQLMEL